MNRLTLLLVALCVLLSGCELNYTVVYNAIAANEDARMAQRNLSHDLQTQAIAKKIAGCMVGPRGAFDGSGTVGAALESHGLRGRRHLTADELNSATDDAERMCTNDLIETAAVSNPKGAAALAAVLMEQHYAISQTYQTAAHKDDEALASVRL